VASKPIFLATKRGRKEWMNEKVRIFNSRVKLKDEENKSTFSYPNRTEKTQTSLDGPPISHSHKPHHS